MSYLTIYTLIWLAVGKPLVVRLFSVIARTRFAQRRRFHLEQPGADQAAREWADVMLIGSDAATLVVALQSHLLHLSADSLHNVLITLVAMILWVDFWMYFTHRWMHRSRWLWLTHKEHHRSRYVQPSSALAFSFIEKVVFYSIGWIGGACVMSWFVPISYVGLIIYFTMYFFLSAIAHSNIVLFKEFLIFPSPAVHCLHHIKPGVNFGFYTTLYDRVFGTYVSPQMHAFVEAMPASETNI